MDNFLVRYDTQSGITIEDALTSKKGSQLERLYSLLGWSCRSGGEYNNGNDGKDDTTRKQ
jgi:hypothetical protein